MKAWTIIGWAYDADMHCNACARERFGDDVEPVDGSGGPSLVLLASLVNIP
jgi:hypothetical protein